MDGWSPREALDKLGLKVHWSRVIGLRMNFGATLR